LKKGNILIWALSLIIAFVLWGYVAFYGNPEDEIIVDNIRIQFINDQYLSSREYILVGGRDATVSVRFVGRRQYLANINNRNVTAVIDLRGIRALGNNPMEYELQGPADLDSVDQYPINPLVTLKVDKIDSKSVNLRLDFNGEIEDGYEREAPRFDIYNGESLLPDNYRVRVTGPVEVLDTIYEAVASYSPHAPLRRSIVEVPVDYRFYTESGQLVDNEYIIANDDVWLTLPIYMVKKVKLEINFIYGGGLKGENISWKVEPESIRVSGDPEILEDTHTILIHQADLAYLQENFNETIPFFLPNGLKNLDLVEEAHVSITIEGVTTKEVSTTNVFIKGLTLPEGYTCIVHPVTITLRGSDNDLRRVEPVHVHAEADFSDLTEITPGFHRRFLDKSKKIEVLGFEETVGAIIKDYIIEIEIIPISEAGS